MSIDRCIEAISSLEEDLDRVLSSADGHSPSPHDEIQNLIRDLTLDIDLRSSTTSMGLMTEVESTVYLPVIEKILALLALGPPDCSDESGTRRQQAKELTQLALTQANALRI